MKPKMYVLMVTGIYFLLWLLPNIFLLSIDVGMASVVKLLLALGFVIIWHGASHRTWPAVLAALPVGLLLPIDLFYTITFREPPMAALIPVIAATTLNETLDFLTGRLVLLLTSIGLVFTFWCVHCRLIYKPTAELAKPRWLVWSSRACLAGVASLMLLAMHPKFNGVADIEDGNLDTQMGESYALPFHLDTLRGVFPLGRIVSLQEYYIGLLNAQATRKKFSNFKFGITPPVTHPDDKTKPVYVLVIGEASRADHWQLGGYAQPTNPLLSTTDGVVFLSDIISPWNHTEASVPVIMSRKAGTDTTRLFGEKSILSAFKEAGFKTYFLSNQAQPGGLRSTIGLFSQEADISVSTNHSSNDITGKSQFDQALVEQFNQLTADTSIAKFFVIHTIGSHDAYNKRYPDRFNRFSPSLSDMPNKNYHDDSNKELAVNAYDNSVLYTDYILKSIIDRLAAATKIGALMYVSDHGEVLFDGSCNFLGHGSRHAPNFPVASLVWVTEGYRKAHPENLEQIKLNSIKKLTTENTFPSLLGIAGIDFLGLDKTMSISSHIFKERSRYVHAGKVVDWDNAEFIGPCQTVQSR